MNSPFKFLDSYTKADKDIFFGRNSEIEELYQKVFESKILLLFGVSGTGKSSLIDCGLGNKIADSDWLPISIRRGSGMVESLMTQLDALDSVESAGKRQSPIGSGEAIKAVVRKLKSVYLDHFKPIYLIFDQFEELFIFGSREERSDFIAIVKAIMEADVQCKMLFSIREEYLANITEFERNVPEIMQNRMRVEKMSRSNAMEVISGPCKVHGIELEDGFEEALMSKLVPEGNEVELTYLQVYLDKVFRMAIDQNPELKEGTSALTFTLSQLKALGNVGDLLGSFLEDQITQLDSPESGLAVLKSFVSIKGTKRQITHEEVLDSCKTLGHEVEDAALKELINKFVDLRILRDKDENGRYELRHDSLAAKIFEKITLVEKEVMEVRLFIENAYLNFQARKTLLSEEDLQYIQAYEERLFLSGVIKKFYDNSKYDIEAAKRSFRKIIAISITGFILLVAAAILYYSQQNQGTEMRKLALASYMQYQNNMPLSLDIALKAYESDSSESMIHKILIEAFNDYLSCKPEFEKGMFDFTPVESGIKFIGLSADGTRLFGYQENNRIHFWDLGGKEQASIQIQGKPIRILRLSDDNKYIGALTDSMVVIHSLEDSSFFQVCTTPNGVNEKYLFDFSCRQEYVLAVVQEHQVILYDQYGNVFQELSEGEGKVNALDISSDKRFIAAGTSEGLVNIWYFNSNTGKYSLYNKLDKKEEGAFWSVQFNSEGNYILASSDDLNTYLKKLSGINIKLGNYPDEFSRILYTRLYGKECDSYFSRGERTMVISLREDDLPDSILYRKSNKYVLHDKSSEFLNGSGSNESMNFIYNFLPYGWGEIMRYDYLVPAPDTRTIAAVEEHTYTVHIIAADHLLLISFEGTCPVFADDSKSVYSIQGNKLQRHIIDPDLIIKYIREMEVLVEQEYNINDIVIY